MNKINTFIAVVLCVIADSCLAAEKLYVAVEGDGKVAVVDIASGRVIKNIDLTEQGSGGHIRLAPHNVQVAPDGRSVWATAIAQAHEPGSSHAGSDPPPAADQVVVIDPASDAIIKRIPVGAGIHLAHVALTPDSRYAYVTAQQEGCVYRIDARNYRIDKRIPLAAHDQPHGLRISPTDGHAYIALMESKGLATLDLATDQVTIQPLSGAAVQTAVTPSGAHVFASLYDTRQIAAFDPKTQALRYLKLPSNSKGPVQIYPTPDSRYLLVADQGYYFEQPSNHLVYKLDADSGAVVAQITAGAAPHGVVVAPRGNRAYVTNLLSGDVSVIDTRRDAEIARIPVGAKPNGISLWSSKLGGTP